MWLKFIFRYRDNNYSFEEVFRTLDEGSRPTLDFYILMFLATVIASFGLLLNNVAIVIGGMLISPLMDPILGVAFSSFIRNVRFTLTSVTTLVTGILFAIFVSWLIGLMFSQIGITPEMLSRTKPNIMDLFVALAAGFLGGYSKVRKTLSGMVFGTAISISLIPPLCVIGIGLAHFQDAIFLGSFLLFLTNLASILLSSMLAFLLGGYIHVRESAKALVVPALSVILLSFPLVYSFFSAVERIRLEREVTDILKSKTYTFHDVDIVDVSVNRFRRPLRLEVTIRASDTKITPKQVLLVQDYLQQRMGKAIRLTIKVMPVLEIDPYRMESFK